ncbi:hypothetical protein ACT2CI_00185 [Candidatus Vidania fulgoroideorum]
MKIFDKINEKIMLFYKKLSGNKKITKSKKKNKKFYKKNIHFFNFFEKKIKLSKKISKCLKKNS